ncbi:MAG TPA: hypothetical protein VKY80_10665 [Croceibacterium sp.]|nr:hypothetical protein [Croceibacterium sp.]
MLKLAAGLMLCVPAALQAQPTPERAFVEGEDGVLVHQASGFRFPQEVAGFVRSDTADLAGSGEYVGVKYSRPLSTDGTLTLRAAVVRIPGLSPEAHYTITKPVVMESLADSRPVAEGPYERIEGSAGYRGVFTGSFEGNPWMRGLWTFERGEWDLRIRADVPRIDLIQADEAMEDFVSALNAGSSLVAASPSNPVEDDAVADPASAAIRPPEDR